MSALLILLLVAVQLPGYVMAWNREKALQRCYRYAADRASERDILDPEGRAYSDMATVIVLEGKCEPRLPQTPGGDAGADDVTSGEVGQ